MGLSVWRWAAFDRPTPDPSRKQEGGKSLRHIGYRPDISGDIFPHSAIAARRRLHQHAMLIAQRTGQPVDLRLGSQRNRRILGQRQIAPHPCNKLLDVRAGKGVVEAEHRLGVRNFDQSRGRRRTDQL